MLVAPSFPFKIPVPVPAFVVKNDEIVTCRPDFFTSALWSEYNAAVDGDDVDDEDDDDIDILKAELAGEGSVGKTTLVLVDLLVGDAGGEGDNDLGDRILLLH